MDLDYIQNSGLLLNWLSETIQNKAKEKKGGFFSMLLGTLSDIILGNLLAGKGINRAADGINTKILSKWT